MYKRTDPKAYKKYKTPRWKQARQIFLIEHPMCKNFAECRNFASHVDHIVPVESDKDPAFWDTENWQGLCLKCHSRKTAKEDGGFGNMKANEKKLNKIKITLYSKEGCKPCEYMTNKINELIPKFREYITGFDVKKIKSAEESKYWLNMFRASGVPLAVIIYVDERGNEKIERVEGDISADSLEVVIKKVIGL